MSEREKVIVLLPAYNEAKNLPILLEKIGRTFKKHRIRGKVLLIDDGSTDDTQKVAKDLRRKHNYLTIVKHQRNMGLAQVFITAFDYIKEGIVVFIPSDLQSDPEEDIPKLLKKLDEGYDLVTGWRRGWNRPWTKVIQSKIYSNICRKLFNVKIHDFNWVRAFRSKIIKDISFLRKDWHRYFVVLVANKGYKIGEVKVTEYPRKKGKSKFNVSRVFTGFIDLLVVKFYLSFKEKPMLFFSIPGVILIFLSFILGVYLFIDWLLGGQHLQLYLIGLMLFLTGIQLFALGFVAELIATMKEEIMNRKK